MKAKTSIRYYNSVPVRARWSDHDKTWIKTEFVIASLSR